MKSLIAFEWRYHTRQVSFFVAAAGFLLFGFALTASGFGPATVKLSSPWLVTESVAFLTLLSVFALAIFASSAVVRDSDFRMAEILNATPVGRFQYLGSRFAGAFLAGLTVFSFSMAGMIIASRMPFQDPERAGAFSIIGYVWAFFIIAIPNLLFISAVLFAIAALTRSTIASSVGAVAIYILYFVSAALNDSPLMAAARPGQAGGISLAGFLDPFGLSAFFEQTHYWTIAQQNSDLVRLSGTFLVNRLTVLIVTALLLAATFRLFSFRTARTIAKRNRRSEPAAASAVTGEAPATVRHARTVSFASARSKWTAFRTAARLEIRTSLRSIPFLIVVALFAALLVTEIVGETKGAEYGSELLPATTILLTTVPNPLSIVGLLVIVYFSSEVMWRERRHRLADTLAATPAPGSIFVASKLAALASMVLTLCVVSILVCVAAQLLAGFGPVHPLLYGSVFLFEAWPLILVASAAVLLQTISPNRYVGLFLTLVVALFTRQGGLLGIEHPLIRFATSPPVSYSDMNGIGDALTPHLWFSSYWSLLALALLIVSAAVWRRSPGARIGASMRQVLRAGFRLPAVLAAFAVVGVWIFYNTNVLNRYETAQQNEDWRVLYEQTYGKYRDTAQPRIEAVQTKVDLFPQERHCNISGSYDLVNRSDRMMTTLLISVRREADGVKMSLDGGRLSQSDAQFGMHTFTLAPPMQPGEKRTLRFALQLSNRGFSAGGSDNALVRNGTFLWSFLHFPLLGYRQGYEMDDPRVRRERGLTLRPEVTEIAEADASTATDWIRYDATVSTSGDQTVLTEGELVRQWTTEGRNFAHFRSPGLMTNVFSFHSARYSVRKSRPGRTGVEVYYDPAHVANVDRMMRAAGASLQHMEKTFGPYSHGTVLRIIEVPSYAQFAGFAMAGTVLMTEYRGFLTDTRDASRLDVASRRVAHEVAHQWWGHGLNPASVAGASTITESLTKLGELEILEGMYGREYVRRSLEFELDRYLKSRSNGAEPTLMTVEGEAGIYYGKGSLVMMAIRDLIGADRMHSALRALMAEQQGPGGNATVTDLVRHLEEVAPEHRILIEQWMRSIVLYDFRVTDVSASSNAGGQFDVTIHVDASKVEADSRGSEKNVDMDEEIAVALYHAGRDGVIDMERPELQKVRMHSGENRLRLRSGGRPEMITIDPYLTRIDRNPFDNSKTVE